MTYDTGVYYIQNLENGKIYVGSSGYSISNRWKYHVNLLEKGTHDNQHLQHSWNKHGKMQFCFGILEFCSKGTTIEREQYWIDTIIPEYNINRTANKPPVRPASADWAAKKERYAAVREGRAMFWRDPSVLSKAAHTANRNRWTDDARCEWSNRMKTSPWSFKVGSHTTQAQKDAVSKAHKGIPKSESTIAKMRKPKSQEHRLAQREAALKRWAEFRATGSKGRNPILRTT